jgi:aerobic-type carbon monoxide dehydrogenase small subunit (CoxS/CutS family)
MKLECRVNNEPVSADVPARLLLSDFIRHDLKLTGTHVGCEMGVCGACTIVVDGSPVRSCLMFAAQADGCDVHTVEYLSRNGKLSRLQEIFAQSHALQCGFCTPGILMTVTAFEGRLPMDEEGVRSLLSGNLCRCTGYQSIVDAVLQFGSARDAP